MAMEENDGQQMKIQSKKKIDNNQEKTKYTKKATVRLGFTDDSQEEDKSTKFVPHMFANKNKKPQDDPEATGGPMTITKMFKNAPPPRVKPKRTVDDISGAEDAEPKNESSKKVKTSETIKSLDRFKFGNSKTVDQSLEEVKNT